MERGHPGYNTRAREAAATAVRTSAAGTSREPPPPPPVDLPPPSIPPPPVLTSRSRDSWEHLLSGGPPPSLQLRDFRLVRRAQSELGSLDGILYGRLDYKATQANVDLKGRVRRVK